MWMHNYKNTPSFLYELQIKNFTDTNPKSQTNKSRIPLLQIGWYYILFIEHESKYMCVNLFEDGTKETQQNIF